MKFLAILVCLSAIYFWQGDRDRLDDTWFIKLRQFIDKISFNQEERISSAWAFGLLLIFLLPMGFLFLVLYATQGLLFGLLTLAIHIFILFMAFDRIHPGILARGYLKHWRDADLTGSFLYLEQELGCDPLPEETDFKSLHSTFSKHYVYRCFEKMFVMFFWYLVAGPLGVLFAYVCYQHRDGDERNRDDKEGGVVQLLIEILEWAPLRLLGLTLSLVGDFDCCIDRLRKTGFVNLEATDETVYDYARYALGIETCVVSKLQESQDQSEQEQFEGFIEPAAREVASLQGLMERSQIIWLCVIAVVTVFGPQI